MCHKKKIRCNELFCEIIVFQECIFAVLQSQSRWSGNYLRLGAGAEAKIIC